MLIYILGLGVVFDLITLRAIVLTVAEKKYRPAVPYVALICYIINLLAQYVYALDASNFSNPMLLLAGGLIAIHILLQAVLRAARKKFD